MQQPRSSRRPVADRPVVWRVTTEDVPALVEAILNPTRIYSLTVVSPASDLGRPRIEVDDLAALVGELAHGRGGAGLDGGLGTAVGLDQRGFPLLRRVGTGGDAAGTGHRPLPPPPPAAYLPRRQPAALSAPDRGGHRTHTPSRNHCPTGSTVTAADRAQATDPRPPAPPPSPGPGCARSRIQTPHPHSGRPRRT